jgi:hypothetical protein
VLEYPHAFNKQLSIAIEALGDGFAWDVEAMVHWFGQQIRQLVPEAVQELVPEAVQELVPEAEQMIQNERETEELAQEALPKEISAEEKKCELSANNEWRQEKQCEPLSSRELDQLCREAGLEIPAVQVSTVWYGCIHCTTHFDL